MRRGIISQTLRPLPYHFESAPTQQQLSMSYDFRRGRQMLVHDPRVNDHRTNPPTALRPPRAFNTWTVGLSEPISHVIGWPAQLAARIGGLDAVHFLAHGSPGYMQIGAGSFDASTVHFFRQFRDAATGQPRVPFIVMFSCSAGGDTSGWYPHHPAYFGQRIAQESGARVVVARTIQHFTFDTANVIQLGPLEGEIDVYGAEGWDEYQGYNPFHPSPALDLERLIFG